MRINTFTANITSTSFINDRIFTASFMREIISPTRILSKNLRQFKQVLIITQNKPRINLLAGFYGDKRAGMVNKYLHKNDHDHDTPIRFSRLRLSSGSTLSTIFCRKMEVASPSMVYTIAPNKTCISMGFMRLQQKPKALLYRFFLITGNKIFHWGQAVPGCLSTLFKGFVRLSWCSRPSPGSITSNIVW
jgi:hypothetical protein